MYFKLDPVVLVNLGYLSAMIGKEIKNHHLK